MSSSNHYNYKPLGTSAYIFTTDCDCEYICTFQRVKSNYGIQEKFPVYGFSFVPKDGTSKKVGRDPKVQQTIVNIFKTFFKKNTTSVLNYICENRDGKAVSRSKAFKRWFETHCTDTGLVLHKTDMGEEFQSAFIFRSNDELKGAIDMLVNLQSLAMDYPEKDPSIEIIESN